MKLEKLKGAEIKKNEMISIKGGTSTTVMIETGHSKNEYPDDGAGGPDFCYEPVLIPAPTRKPGC